MRKIVISYCLIAALGAMPCLSGDYIAPSPKEIVERYLELDAKGKYLTQEGRAEMARLAGGPPESNQVVFTTHVISGYRILSSKIVSDTATVIVEYDDVGSIVEDFYKFNSRRRKSKFNFKLQKNPQSIWEISSYPAPNMSVDTVAQHLEEVAREAHNPKYFQNLIQRIREAAKQPLKK